MLETNKHIEVAREVEILKTEYSTELANRQVWRKRINELERGA